MPASWITKSDASEIRLAHPVNRSKLATATEAVYDLANDPALQDADKDRLALTLKTLIQEDLTLRVKVRDLPADEPTKTVDPAPEFGERMFWEGRGGNRDLVARSTIVENVVWDGTRFVFVMRRAR